MPFQRNRVIPPRINAYRARHWKALVIAEKQRGHGMHLIRSLREKIQQFTVAEKNKRVTQRQTTACARKLILIASELTDELQTATQQTQQTLPTWNQQYIRVIRGIWREIPPALRTEILNPSKE